MLDRDQEELTNKKKQLLGKRKEVNDEIEKVEDSIRGIGERRNRILDQRKEASKEIKNIEDSLKDLFKKLELKPRCENENLISFLVKSIEEKEAELTCPVCLDTAVAPIFMCLQMHLICSNCQPRVASCPECREAYQGPPRRHRYAERDAEELKKLQNELAKMTLDTKC